MPHYNLPHNHGQNIEKVLNKMPSAEGFNKQRLNKNEKEQFTWKKY